MKLMLENWRKYFGEVTIIDRDLKKGLRDAIINSEFWTYPHTVDEVDLDRWDALGTPATEVLTDVLNEAAKDLGTNARFTITANEDYPLGPADQYGGYPNNWMTRGVYLGPLKARPYHQIWLAFRPLTEDYNMGDLDPDELATGISRRLNHEMIHYEQLKKQAKSKGISDEEAWEEMRTDPRQIAKGVGPGNRGNYLTRHIEVDAFAHEAAEELLDAYSADEALQLIKTRDSELRGVVRDYLNVLGDNPTEMKKFWSKLYTQIKRQNETNP